MPDLKELTTKQMETKETVKRFSAACTALQNGSNPISTTMFRKLPEAVVLHDTSVWVGYDTFHHYAILSL